MNPLVYLEYERRSMHITDLFSVGKFSENKRVIQEGTTILLPWFLCKVFVRVAPHVSSTPSQQKCFLNAGCERQDKELAQIRQEAIFYVEMGRIGVLFVGFLGWKGFQQVVLLTFPFLIRQTKSCLYSYSLNHRNNKTYH